MDDSKKDKKEAEVPEIVESAEGTESTENILSQPTEEEKLSSELAQTNDRLLRLAAEFENYKKIAARERMQSLKFANEALIVSLLPAIDNLEQAVKAGKKADQAQDLLIGVEMVLKQMIEALNKVGVEFFNSEGQPFDPNRHEAVCEQESQDQEAGTVVQEFQKGCLYNGRLLRASRVAVAKKPSK